MTSPDLTWPDQHCPADPPLSGSVTHEEGCILSDLADELGGPVLEIGSRLGASTRYILQGLDEDQRLDSVDLKHQWKSDDERLKQLVGNSQNIPLPYLHYRWAFIDGDHSYEGVLKDIERCVGLGITDMIFHDTDEDSQERLDIGVLNAILYKFDNDEDWTIHEYDTHCGMIRVTQCP